MRKSSTKPKFKVYFIDNFSWFTEKQGLQEYQINSYLSSVCVHRIFWPIRKNLWMGNVLNLKLNTGLSTKKIRKLDVDAFREEGKRLKSQIHLIIISRDC